MEKIRLQMSDWLYNAGLVGFVNILEYAKDNVEYNGQEVLVDKDVLENFEEKYFKYFIDTYEKKLSWYKIINFEEFIKKHEDEDYKKFDETALEKLNEYIGSASKSGSLKYLITSNSYKAAYELINNKFNVLDIEKRISTIKLKKGETIVQKLDEIKETIDNIKKIIGYCSSHEGKKYISGKNVIYTLIKNAWNGVSFLNPQTKEKDMYIDYKKYFVEETLKCINESTESYKYNCFNCGRKMKGMNNELSFLNAIGFDTGRKPSHVWNFVNDIAICPICKFTYSCVPAGFTYLYNRGIYINENHSIENAVKINNKVKLEILNDEERNQNTTFKAMITAMQEVVNDTAKYELADIQVVRYENNNNNEKYRFNILSKRMLIVLNNCKDDLNNIINAGYNEINTYFRIYDEVMKTLLNNENLFLLIHKLFTTKISKQSDARFNNGHIKNILKINFEYLKGVGCMENMDKDLLKSYSGAGYYLKQAYKEKNSENKLNGITYRLLNSLKTNNKNMFMDTILNCYLYTGKQVPGFFTDCLKETETFKTIGYAFVSGLIEGEGKNNENNKVNGGNK